MKNYSDPQVWAEFLRGEGIQEEIPPPSEEYLSFYRNVHPMDGSVSGNRDWIRECLAYKALQQDTNQVLRLLQKYPGQIS